MADLVGCGAASVGDVLHSGITPVVRMVKYCITAVANVVKRGAVPVACLVIRGTTIVANMLGDFAASAAGVLVSVVAHMVRSGTALLANSVTV